MYDLKATIERVKHYVGKFVTLPSGESAKLKLSDRLVRESKINNGITNWEESWPLWSECNKYVFSENFTEYAKKRKDGVYEFFKVKEPIKVTRDSNDKTSLGYELYISGYVNRYHSHPHPHLRNAQDLTDAHSNRMVKLLYLIFPEFAHSSNLVAYIVMHDAGESVSGDSPFLAKIQNPKLKEALDEVESQRLAQFYELFQNNFTLDLTVKELQVAKILDLLESFLFQTIHAPGLQKRDSKLYNLILTGCAVFGKSDEVQQLMDFALDNSQQGE